VPALQAIDREEARAALQYSIAGRLGLALERVTQWCGFDWRTNVALLSGFAAKELILSTMGTAYSMGRVREVGDLPLSEQLAQESGWNKTRALALIVFIMLYAPCLATIVCIIKEAGAWRWGIFSLVFNTTVAFLAAVLVYQGGRWLGFGRW
jgi:ferrous iron transport protein B